MAPLIEKHQITIQVVTIVIVVTSIIGLTQSFTEEKERNAARLSTLEHNYESMATDLLAVRRKGYKTDVELAKINTKLESIAALLTEIKDEWRQKIWVGGGE